MKSSSSAGRSRCDFMRTPCRYDSAGEWSKPGRAALRQRGARGVQHHGEKGVVTGYAHDVDDALFAEGRERAGVRRVAHTPVLLQLDREIVEDLFVLGHALGPAPLGHGARDVVAQPALERQLMMRGPLVVLRPL